MMTLLNKKLWSKRQVNDQMPEFNEHKFKDPVVGSTFSCTVAMPCKPWSHRIKKCYNLELLKLQKVLMRHELFEQTLVPLKATLRTLAVTK